MEPNAKGKGEAAAVVASNQPLTPNDVVSALRATGIESDDLIIVHTSLSALGWLVGGPQSILVALRETVGSGGTIVMPAQTGISDPSHWRAPPVPNDWWPTIRETWPAFDPFVTPLRAMGAVVECFRRSADVHHSGHPAVGFVAQGPLAELIVGEHPLEQGLCDRSPLGRLYSNDAKIVLIGVDHSNNTTLHLAEYRADYPGKKTKQEAAPLLVDGVRQWVTYTDLDYDDDDFSQLGQAFVTSGGTQTTAALGNGEVKVCRAREIVDFGVEWITKHRSN